MMSYEEYRRMGADPEIAEIFVEAEARMRRRDKERAEAHTESQIDEIGAAVILSVHADFRAWDDEDWEQLTLDLRFDREEDDDE